MSPARPPRRRCVLATGLPGLVVVAVIGCGGQSAAPPADPGPQPPAGITVDEVLNLLTTAYRGADAYFDNAEYRESFIRQGENRVVEPPPHQVSVAFERPNRFRVSRSVPAGVAPGLEVVVASDGQRLVATVSDLPGQLLEKSAPEAPLNSAQIAPDPTLRRALLPVPLENLFPQLDLLTATAGRPPRLLADAEARLLASRAIEGKDCYRVELARPAGRYVLWIDPQTGVLRRVDVPAEEVRRELDPEGAMLDWRFWIDLRDATLGGTMSRSVFRPEPPEGAEPVEEFDTSKQAPSQPAPQGGG